MGLKNRWVAIHTGAPHYLDHIGILSILLKIPLIVTEEATFLTAKKFYPLCQIELMSLSDLSLDFLASNFDVIFESGHLWAQEMIPLFKLLLNKTMRIVYCPHGNSDKINTAPKDITLFYGDHMRTHLEKTGSEAAHYIRTGNYRLQYYQNHPSFYYELLEKQLSNRLDPTKETILYAPSWSDGTFTSAFLKAQRVIEEVGELYNLIIRWHPFLDEIDPVATERIRGISRYGIVILDEFPCIYPILNRVDRYLGDVSSIGYDFLSLNKPLYFLDEHQGIVHRCGVALPESQHWGRAIQDSKETTLLKKLRKKSCEFVFGNNRKVEDIKKEIEKALS